ncbi:MAG: phage minor head protein [Desulfovibrionaceae bacterium]
MQEKRPRTARPAVPNKGIETKIRRQLLHMVDEMQRSVLWWVGATYKARLPEIAQDAARPRWKRALLYALDASPSRDLERALKKVMRRWEGRFGKMALQLAQKSVRNTNTSATRAMQSALKDAGFTVKMRNTRAVNDVLQSLVIEQTNLIKSIPQVYMGEVQALVMRSVREGRDMGFLTEQLETRYGMTRKRAITISRDQTNTATESISRVRNKALGITHGVWMHRSGSKKPRHSHIEANGKVFDLSIGLMVDGETIFPGEKVNCHCTYRPVLPTFPGEETQA